MSLIEKLLKNSTIKETAVLSKSKVFGNKPEIITDVPMINAAVSTKIDKGLQPGVFMLAAPSKHFKTAFALMFAGVFLKKYPDGVILFYDSEFGSPDSYYESFGVDKDRVVHTPITNIEDLKFDLTTQLQALDKKDNVMILIDSVGNLASKKEVEDAIDQKSVADMTRAKQFKSLYRIITPMINLKDIWCIAINHTYKEMALFPRDVVSGGTGGMYSSDTVWTIGRQQEKDGAASEISGYNFVINIEKSRHVKEKTKIPITVSFRGGIQNYSGLDTFALAGGWIIKGSKGYYDKIDKETGEVIGNAKIKTIGTNADFWESILADKSFGEYITESISITGTGSDLDNDLEE